MSVERVRSLPLRAYVGALLLVIVVVTLVTTAYGLARAEEDGIRAAEADAQFGATLGAAEIGASLTQLQLTVSRTAANPAVAAIFDTTAPCNLTFGTVGVFGAARLEILRPDGSVRCTSAAPPVADVSYQSASWLAEALRAPILVAPVVDARTGSPSVVSAAPIATRGVLAVFVDVGSAAPDLSARFGGPSHLVFSIVNGSGVALSGAERGSRPVITGTADVSGSTWHVTTTTDRATVVGSADAAFYQQAQVTLVGLLVILVAVILVHRGITYPLVRLDRDVARRISSDQTPRLEERGPSEVRQLTRNFNALVASLREELAQRLRSDEQARTLQHRLEQSQRLESLGQLAGGVAHDFNNLLAVILNYNEFVSDALPQDSPVRSDLDEVRRAAERAADLTRQLLILARREVMKLELLDVNAVVLGLEGLLRRTLGEHIELTTKLAPSLSAVRADRGQLDQVLMNIVLNARDAMPDGGRIVIETAELTLDDEYVLSEPGAVAGRYVRLTVSDTGGGMAPDVAARAFEPFFTTKSAGRGTGLGLATVYGIVTGIGGNVRIYSEPGHGTLIAVQLPSAIGVAGPRPAQIAPAPLARSSGHILLVEDESAVLLAAVRILSAQGYSVKGTSDAEEALRALERADLAIDVLVTDLVMPAVSGTELARRARAARPGLPIVFMTGYSREIVSRNEPLEGVFIQKPFTRETLLRAVDDALSTAVSRA